MATKHWFAAAAAVVGLGVGFGLGRVGGGGASRGASEPMGFERGSSSSPRKTRGPASPSDRFDAVDRHTSLLDEPDGDDGDAPTESRLGAASGGDLAKVPSDETPAQELARLRKEVERLEADRVEMFGEPISAPPGDAPGRYGGGSVSSAVRQALADENVGGDVETVDCSEHPCIIFGRLEGDEEDMEEIERSPAMSQYDDDVLTLLFWATSVERGGEGGDGGGGGDGGEGAGDGGEGTGAGGQPETGLFALSFYSREERAQRGEELDRRTRARVMEYWNVVRPGKTG